MNQASQYLLALAKQKIQAYIANLEAKAAMITGSTATGQIAPENLYIRLESLYHQEPLSAASQLKELVAETVELVELHMPAIDTSKVRESLDRQEHSWKPVIEENK